MRTKQPLTTEMKKSNRRSVMLLSLSVISLSAFLYLNFPNCTEQAPSTASIVKEQVEEEAFQEEGAQENYLPDVTIVKKVLELGRKITLPNQF